MTGVQPGRGWLHVFSSGSPLGVFAGQPNNLHRRGRKTVVAESLGNQEKEAALGSPRKGSAAER